MQEKSKGVHVRFASSHRTLATRAGHTVRTITEKVLCEWLTAEGIAHRHGNEVFIVKAASNGSPSLFVPDIILANKSPKNERMILIETLHNFSPKRGGLRTFSAFCKQYHDQFYSILVARKASLESVPRRTCDAHVALENIEGLQKILSRLF